MRLKLFVAVLFVIVFLDTQIGFSQPILGGGGVRVGGVYAYAGEQINWRKKSNSITVYRRNGKQIEKIDEPRWRSSQRHLKYAQNINLRAHRLNELQNVRLWIKYNKQVMIIDIDSIPQRNREYFSVFINKIIFQPGYFRFKYTFSHWMHDKEKGIHPPLELSIRTLPDLEKRKIVQYLPDVELRNHSTIVTDRSTLANYPDYYQRKKNIRDSIKKVERLEKYNFYLKRKYQETLTERDIYGKTKKFYQDSVIVKVLLAELHRGREKLLVGDSLQLTIVSSKNDTTTFLNVVSQQYQSSVYCKNAFYINFPVKRDKVQYYKIGYYNDFFIIQHHLVQDTSIRRLAYDLTRFPNFNQRRITLKQEILPDTSSCLSFVKDPWKQRRYNVSPEEVKRQAEAPLEDHEIDRWGNAKDFYQDSLLVYLGMGDLKFEGKTIYDKQAIKFYYQLDNQGPWLKLKLDPRYRNNTAYFKTSAKVKRYQKIAFKAIYNAHTMVFYDESPSPKNVQVYDCNLILDHFFEAKIQLQNLTTKDYTAKLFQGYCHRYVSTDIIKNSFNEGKENFKIPQKPLYLINHIPWRRSYSKIQNSKLLFQKDGRLKVFLPNTCYNYPIDFVPYRVLSKDKIWIGKSSCPRYRTDSTYVTFPINQVLTYHYDKDSNITLCQSKECFTYAVKPLYLRKKELTRLNTIKSRQKQFIYDSLVLYLPQIKYDKKRIVLPSDQVYYSTNNVHWQKITLDTASIQNHYTYRYILYNIPRTQHFYIKIRRGNREMLVDIHEFNVVRTSAIEYNIGFPAFTTTPIVVSTAGIEPMLYNRYDKTCQSFSINLMNAHAKTTARHPFGGNWTLVDIKPQKNAPTYFSKNEMPSNITFTTTKKHENNCFESDDQRVIIKPLSTNSSWIYFNNCCSEWGPFYKEGKYTYSKNQDGNIEVKFGYQVFVYSQQPDKFMTPMVLKLKNRKRGEDIPEPESPESFIETE